jgi:UDP-N-acetylglucosamine 2-epimerase
VTLAVVQGTRPEILKNYSIVRALSEARVPFLVLHTDQHSTVDMCDVMYADMGYRPHQTLKKAYRIGTAIDWLQDAFAIHGVQHVIVNGDTAASLAGAIAAMYMDIGVSHVEAGLRSRDEHMLEERNRIMVDAIASHLFAYTEYERTLLSNCREVRGTILVEGNTTVDLIHDFRHRIESPGSDTAYIFLTLHRRELTTSPERLRGVITALNRIADTLHPIIFPVHPRTAQALRCFDLARLLSPNIHLLGPLGVFASLGYQRQAALVITDSGCVQEETYLLGTPCVTLRENTERHLTVAHGANRLSGFDPRHIESVVREALESAGGTWPDIYGGVGVGRRIVDRIVQSGGFDWRPNADNVRGAGELLAVDQ